ncbi:cytochrome c-type biogenesis protein CcmH [Sphingomonas sp. DBB INV C78]|uniref:cytochrome c-type biogenesis protein n=1 Tax=Sphingomonas sp. DBB INV C78 TaxID=3349434 RepID=UPI0036D3A174
MRRLAILAALMVASPAIADSVLPPAELAYTQLPDAKQEEKATALMKTLRCLVCQGQSIADSDAEMAGDMRALVRSKIAAGESPDQVRHWLIERYGNWVTYDPPLDRLTWPLWALPALLILVGAFLARGRFKRRKH